MIRKILAAIFDHLDVLFVIGILVFVVVIVGQAIHVQNVAHQCFSLGWPDYKVVWTPKGSIDYCLRWQDQSQTIVPLEDLR